MTRDEQIAKAVARLDVTGAEDQDAAWVQLRPLGFAIVPYLSAAYPEFRTWQGRAALVYYATRYARVSEPAVDLGLTALNDRSYMVRYRACGLLAYSLEKRALERLGKALEDDRELVAQSAQAAINAIRAGNHHLFADTGLSGRTSWSVNPGDIAVGGKPPPIPSRLKRIVLGIRPAR